MLRRWRRRRQLEKVEPGDGRRLRRYRPWHLLWRSRFLLDAVDAAGEDHVYVVDVDFAGFDNRAELYRNGLQVSVAKMPATFPVPGGVVEVAATVYGMKRVHLVPDTGPERQLRPARGTAEHWRARLDHRHPRLGRALAVAAIVVLLVGLGLGLPQAAARISEISVIAERFGTFTSPISLPGWANTTLLIAGVAAATERALTLRNHWLIDADTWWLGG